VTEYELVDDGRELALTLLRATGWLSRDRHPCRDYPAGPQLPTPQAQCLGETATALAVLPHARGWAADGVLDAAEQWAHDVHTAPGSAPRAAPLTARTGLEVTGDGVVFSSLRRRDGELVLRVVAQTEQPTRARVRGRFAAARRIDLLGRPGEVLTVDDGELVLPLSPWEIATVCLR
jgi:alpha-mannosidase